MPSHSVYNIYRPTWNVGIIFVDSRDDDFAIGAVYCTISSLNVLMPAKQSIGHVGKSTRSVWGLNQSTKPFDVRHNALGWCWVYLFLFFSPQKLFALARALPSLCVQFRVSRQPSWIVCFFFICTFCLDGLFRLGGRWILCFSSWFLTRCIPFVFRTSNVELGLCSR